MLKPYDMSFSSQIRSENRTITLKCNEILDEIYKSIDYIDLEEPLFSQTNDCLHIWQQYVASKIYAASLDIGYPIKIMPGTCLLLYVDKHWVAVNSQTSTDFMIKVAIHCGVTDYVAKRADFVKGCFKKRRLLVPDELVESHIRLIRENDGN